MGELSKKLIHCYNKGCGKIFDVSDNPEDCCIFHSGVPYFHDAYKEWTCCKKKTTDFTEFLNIPGCCRGMHNGDRPASLDKPAGDDNKLMKTVENIFSKCTTMNNAIDKPVEIREDLPLIAITPQISSRFVQLSFHKEENKLEQWDKPIPVGTLCKNTSCGVSYTPGIGNECFHHPGTAIFHEGLKYWSCCKKKTTEFSKFLDQAGCAVGSHLWFKEKENVECRLDWHQTGSQVIVSLFVKGYDPHKSVVSLSPMRLKIYVYLPVKEQIYEREGRLFSAVNVEQSSVSMMPTKIEIKLSKALGDQWKNLWK